MWHKTLIAVLILAAAGQSVWPCAATALSCPQLAVEQWARLVEQANSLVDARSFDDAESIYRQALSQAQADRDDLRAALVLRNLGWLSDRRGDFLRAEKLYLKSIQSLARRKHNDDATVVRISIGLTTLYIQTGQHSKGEALVRRLLDAHPGSAEPDRAILAGNLGVILSFQQRWAEAGDILRQTAERCTPSSTGEMLEVCAIARANLAAVQLRAGGATAALASFQQAIATLDALHNPSPATFAGTLADYARALRQTGSRHDSETLFLRSISLAQARLGPAHPLLGAILQDYAQLLRELGRKTESRTLSLAARRILKDSARNNLTGHTVEYRSLLGAK